jgi:hypothetical protein
MNFKLIALTSTTLFISSTLSVNAATLIYTDKTAWENALGGQFLTEDFAGGQLNNSGVSYVSTSSGHINPAQENYQDVLAHESATEPMTTWSFSPEITAYGGDWTLGGPGGSGNSLQVYVDSDYVGYISNSYNGEFWGFISDTPFSSVELIGGSSSNQQHYSLDNMVFSPVPVPAAVWLFGSGILGLVSIVRRKKV